METPWDPLKWKPTSTEPPSDVKPNVPALGNQLADHTRLLRRHPYNPVLWLERAKVLSSLKYPELATNDAYKAELLCQNALSQVEKSPCFRLGYQCGFWMEDEEGVDESLRGAFEERFALLQSDAFRIQTEQLNHFPTVESGDWRPQPYPWMEERYLHRSNNLIDLINHEFSKEAKSRGESPRCQLQRHAFGVSYTNPAASSDVLGVFALKDIPAGSTILYESTRLFGCDGPGHDALIAPDKCRTCCGDPLHPNLPDDEYNQDLRWIRDVLLRKRTRQVVLGARMLLTIVQDQGIHSNPLDHDLVARLTPKYSSTGFQTFCLEGHIRIPNKVLRQLGVDIFANANWDGWVLFTIEARHCNNAWANCMHTGIHPLFSLFNHSCQQNADWYTQEEPTEMEVKAATDIRQGEQIFICYDQYLEKKNVLQRRTRLKTWLDDDCQCTRCINEEAYNQKHGITLNEGEDEPAEWDTPSKPVFPEDSLPIIPIH